MIFGKPMPLLAGEYGVGLPPAERRRVCQSLRACRVGGAARPWPTSGAREDDELLGRSGHCDIAVDRSFDTPAERLRVDEDDQVELEPLRQLRGQRPDAGGRPERGTADDAGDPVAVRGEPGAEDRAQIR